ncbi:MAG TPA: histidine kinase [Ktedonobacterales bacterium]
MSGSEPAAEERRSTRLIVLMTWLVSTVWLTALIPAVAAAFSSYTIWRLILTLAGTATFLAIYLPATGADAREFAMTTVSTQRPLWRLILPAALLSALAFFMIFTVDINWGTLFIFAVVTAARRLAIGPALIATAALALVPFTALARNELTLVTAAQDSSLIAVVGVTVIGMRWAFITNRDLRIARRELARLAITEERLRFARDLHDLLGHTLSLIALKSELAGRLASVAPERAQAELAGIESAARGALRDVRAAVAGYRQMTLAGELDAARDLLAVAGITCVIRGAGVQPPPAIEAALAWATREASANIIRHSRARSCALTLSADDAQYTLLVEDDGKGALDARGGEEPGNGLRGLAERAARLGGTLSSGPRAEGGYALRFTVPASRSGASVRTGETGERSATV